MRTTLKTLGIAAFATASGFIAAPAAQAQESFYQNNLYIEEPGFEQINDGYYDEYRPIRRHYLRRHNGFTFSYQFGNSGFYIEPNRPRIIHRPRPVVHLTQAHVNWCYDRYRTYDHRSNSFVIRHGQRAYCVSPYSY